MVWAAREQPNVPYIAVGIPHMESCTFEWAMRMLGPLLFVPANWCVKLPQMARGIPQNLARDQIVEMALKDNRITHILWVDSDNVAEQPEDVNVALRMLYECNQPIVSGLYRAKQAEGFNYAAWMDAKLPEGKLGFLPVQQYTGNFFKVDVIGLGFCLVRTEVYKTVPPPWHPWDKPAPSEDFRFCLKAAQYGYKAWVFAEVKMGHIGTLNVHPDGKVTTLKV